MSLIADLLSTRGTIGRAHMWVTAICVEIAMVFVPDSPVITSERVKLQVRGGSVEGPRFHFAAPGSADDWISLLSQCAGWAIVGWVFIAALIRRLRAHGRSPYWSLLLPAFFVLIETEIAVNPGPSFSLMGVAFAVLFIPIVVFMTWGMIDIFFRRGVYEGGPADTSGDLRGAAPPSETPAR